jgi:hypothetical protein
MISLNETNQLQSDARLRLKTHDQTLIRQAMMGAGLTQWAAQVLPQVVEEIYFSDGGSRPWKDGQVRFACVAATVGAGKPLAECALVPVTLSVFCVSDDREVLRRDGAVALRRLKVMRVAEEAREQGGLLTQEELGVLLHCDERTIRRDVKALKMLGIHVPTRGFVQDIGPTLSHKAQAIRGWLQGQEPVGVARAIHHSLAATERYLSDFRRVSLLVMKELDNVTIARAAHLSPALVATYVAMYQEARATPAYAYRFEELQQLLNAAPASATQSGKKGAL